MEIISDNIDSKNLSFISDASTGDDSNDKSRIIGNTNENVIYALNPLLSESLNNLVKRFERTKIPKPPPTKGHSIRKKSRIHSSLPNIFLPSIFDDNNKYSSDKKVQWTNKLNLDLEKMKILFRDNYNNWCKQKQRSQSIPNLLRNTDEADSLDSSSQNVDFICSRSKDENNMTIKFTKCDLKSTNDPENPEESSHGRANLANSDEKAASAQDDQSAPNLEMGTTEPDDQVAYSKHIYLDGAIIEPISPASPIQSSQLPELVAAVTDSSTDTVQETAPRCSDQSLEVPMTQSHGGSKNKRGRKPGKKKSKSLPPKKVKSDLQIIDLTGSKELECLVESMEEAPRLEQETELDSGPVSVIELQDNIELISLGDELQELHPTEIGSPPDQTNDLEVLSKSITNSVDTSMLPPRKRYKRLMYLETNKTTPVTMTTTTTAASTAPVTGSGSPKVPEVHEEETKAESPRQNDTSTPSVPPPELKPQQKAGAARSRSKRKKKSTASTSKTSPSVKVKSQSVVVIDDPAVVIDSALPDHLSHEPMDCELTTSDSQCAIDRVAPDPSTGEVGALIDKKAVEKLFNSFIETVTMETDRITPTLADNAEVDSKPVQSAEATIDREDKVAEKSPGTVSGTVTKKPLVKKSPEKTVIEPNRKQAPSIVRPESLKRSKREAAARGFANMVAMSLNNSNSSQVQTGTESVSVARQQQQHATDSSMDTAAGSGSPATGKMFKRPRKTKTNEPPLGPTKSKQKRASSPIATVLPVDSVDNNGEKSAIYDEVPASPNGTITSSIDSTSGAGSCPVTMDNSIKFRKIRTNTYIDPKPLYWFEDVERCGCKPSRLRGLTTDKSRSGPVVMDTAEQAALAGSSQSSKSKPPSSHQPKKRHSLGSAAAWDCGDNCLNRLTYTECPAKRCQCGDACGNQKIRKAEWAPGLQVRDFPGKGKGVVTTKPIREGAFVIEYVGEVINERTFQERMSTVYRDDAHHYCLHLDGDMLIDAYRAGSLARFVNHSCAPNCEMQKWLVNGAYRMCLFATEPIAPDTELYYDYNFCSFNTLNTQICVCGSPACRGFIGSRPRAEQTATQKDRKKLLYIFGRALSSRERLFIVRNTVFLLRNRELGRCQRLGIRRPRVSHGNRLPSTISEIKRRKAKKNQFLTQMSALNSIRSIKTRQLRNAEENEALTRAAQLGQVLKDLYNTLLEQKDPARPGQQLVAAFIHPLNRRRYPEFYRMTASGPTAGTGSMATDTVASLGQIYTRLLDGDYQTMLAFDHDVLQMLHQVESYAGKQSTIGQTAERIKPVYRELKQNSIALLEALTDEPLDERDKQKLLSNNLQLVSQALRTHSSHQAAVAAAVANDNAELPPDSGAATATSHTNRAKKRKQTPAGHQTGGGAGGGGGMGARGRLERGAEVIKCVCGFLVEAGHVMVQCERCFVWQHAYCMNVARSAELADVTRMDPYYCHVCSGIATESLVREIPRHFVISDETIGSDNTLFWTLTTGSALSNGSVRDELLKIDDFVYIRDGDESLARKTIMRIYSLWKDCHGQRWMEGGLFLRPYDGRLRGLLDRHRPSSAVAVGPTANKRKSGGGALPVLDLDSHKWHLHEVVYTDLTTILPLDACLGRCFVLNSYTFRHGKPLLLQSASTTTAAANIDVFVCDWMINQHGDWSELDPAYLKINTKPYCFERFQDSGDGAANERFSRQYLEQDLRKIDDGISPSSEAGPNTGSPKSNGAGSRRLSNEQRTSMKMLALKKLLNKLVDFAQQRNQNLPLSSTPSTASGSNPSSRGASPLSETSGSKSPIRPVIDVMTHRPRKSLMPRKLTKKQDDESSDDTPLHIDSDAKPSDLKESLETVAKESGTIASDTSESSPQLVIVVDEFQQTPKTDELASSRTIVPVEKAPSVDDKDDLETKTVSSVKENVDEQSSNLGSEINFGDFVNLLKSVAEPAAQLAEPVVPTVSAGSTVVKAVKQQQHGRVQRKGSKKGSGSRKRGSGSKKQQHEIKPVSEISPAEDEWIPIGGSAAAAAIQISAADQDRPRTRSRRMLAAAAAAVTSDSVVVATTTVTVASVVPADEAEGRPESCSSSSNNNTNNTDVELILTGPNIKGIFTSSSSSTNTTDDNPVSMTTGSLMVTVPSSSAMLQSTATATALTTSTAASQAPLASSLVAVSVPGPIAVPMTTGRPDNDDEDDSTKCCFVKLERMKMRQKQDQKHAPSPSLGSHWSSDTGGSEQQKTYSILPLLGHNLDKTVSVAMRHIDSGHDHSVAMTTDNSTSNSSSDCSTGQQSTSVSSVLVPVAGPAATVASSSSSSSPNSSTPSLLSSCSSASTVLSRSKRKKGVPKRIPFDFPYPQAPALTTASSSLATAVPAAITTTAPLLGPCVTGTATPPTVALTTGFDDEIVDLSAACRPVGGAGTGVGGLVPPASASPVATDTQQQSSSVTNSDSSTQLLAAPATPGTDDIATVTSDSSSASNGSVVEPVATVMLVAAVVVPETRHITAANDFSSIENISSN